MKAAHFEASFIATDFDVIKHSKIKKTNNNNSKKTHHCHHIDKMIGEIEAPSIEPSHVVLGSGENGAK